MSEYIEGGLTMGLQHRFKEPGKLHRMPQKETKTSWHHDWRGNLYLRVLNTGIGIAALATIGTVVYAFSHHIFH